MSGTDNEWITVQRNKPRKQKLCYIEDNDSVDPVRYSSGMEIHANGGPTRTRWVRPQSKSYSFPILTPESRALQQTKNAIQRECQWDDFKKITNPYEYVFLSWNRRSSRSVATRQPLSRSYFKMIEIWQTLELSSELATLVTRDGGLKTAHAAEGPGGFIEACWEQGHRQGWCVKQSDAITLHSDARNIPGWRKAVRFLAERPQIRIHEGMDGTGDILKRANQDAFLDCARGAHVYTADGGFDFSSDYNSQEDTIFPLLLAEFLIGLQVVTQGGCIVVKCFDTLEKPTLDLLWIVSRCFREWTIFKPRTSRAGNAERYFIGKGRLPHIEDAVEFLQRIQEEEAWQDMIEIPEEEQREWKEWRQQILEFQEKMEHQEYKIIRKTLDLIHAYDFTRIRSLVRENVKRAVEWCREFDEPYASSWANDMERNITKETQDLLHIISPPQGFQHSWYTRTASNSITFQEFRSNSVEAVYKNVVVNPFTRNIME
jgi:hypothetical protein